MPKKKQPYVSAPKQVHVEPIFSAGYCRDFSFAPSAYRIQNALQQTPVISEEFKSFIIGWLFATAQEAFDAGVNAARNGKIE